MVKSNIKITSDGTPGGTNIVETNTGISLNNQVKEIRWTHKAWETPEVELVLCDVEIEVEGVNVVSPRISKPEAPPIRYVREDGKQNSRK